MKELLTHARTILHNISDTIINSPTVLKLIALITACWMHFVGIHSYIYAVIALTVIDVATGIIASIKKGEKFKSRILRKGLIEKVCLYLIIMVSTFILESVIRTGIELETYWLVMVATTLISTYEFSSIVENLLVINPNLTFLKRLQKISNNMANKTVNDEND